MSQFAFLEAEFADVFAHARKAEALALADARAACFYARLALEIGVQWLYAHDRTLQRPYQDNLSALIHEPTFRRLVTDRLVTKAKIIKDIGNLAVHETRGITADKAVTALRELFHFGYWLARTYAKATKPAPGIAFSAEALKKTVLVETTNLAKLREIAAKVEAAEQARKAAEAERMKSDATRAALEAEIAALQAEVARVKAANQATADTHDYNEAETRDAFIDLLLHEAGWTLDQPRDREYRVTGMPNVKDEGFVDYVLWGADGRPLALVEAKRTRRDPREGQHQAKLYADALERQFGQRPIIFYTNGYEHWIWDDLRYPPRPIQGFLKRDELELAIQRRQILKKLAETDIDGKIVERPYQSRAIRRITETFEADHMRKALLVMATGAGKTRAVIALSDLLMRANWARRILFLADRVALVTQATNAFKKFLQDASPVNLVTQKGQQGRVYVSTYPTMMGLIDDTANGVRRFGPGHFDLIVIDEAHRSVYRKYKAIFDYFDSLLVGLTATPKDEIDRDTYGLFDLERGVPTDAYGLDEAVRDGYLVPPKAISVPLKFQRQGIRYDDLPDDEKEAWDALEWSEDGTVPTEVDPAELNKWLFNADTVDKVLEHLMTHGQRVAEGDRLAKTIVFAKNHDHAVFIAERFDKNYPHLKGHFCRVIDFKTEYVQDLIDKFSDAAKEPHLAVSVDMLDTGIDIPEVANLVFFKVVRSKTKFWQMIGRGTRLCHDLFGPGRDKQFFYVFDYCQNFEFFNANPEMAEPRVSGSLSERIFQRRVQLVTEVDRGRKVEGMGEPDPMIEWRYALADILREYIKEMSLDNFIVRPQRRLVEKYREEDAWKRLDLDSSAELIEHLANLPTGITDNDVPAKQFDLLVLNAQLGLLKHQKAFEGYRKRIVEIAEALEGLSNIPLVAAQLTLIQEVQTNDYWQDITAPILEDLRKRLRGLVGLIEGGVRRRLYSDFEDEIGQHSEMPLAGVPTGPDMSRFRDKALHCLKSHLDHIAVQKARRNEALTPQDIEELGRLFKAAGLDNLAPVDGDGGFGPFIRSLVGLERDAAKQLFAAFQQTRTLTAAQLEFLNLIIDYLTERGAMEPKRLYESPFTDLNDAGVEGVFPKADVVELVGILDSARKSAA